MKRLLLLLCCLSYCFIKAQDCTRHLLMQKGTQLEYKVYLPKPDSSNNMTGKAINRLLFEVEQVRDSAGSTYSTIIKRGFSFNYEKNHFERKIVLKCDGTNLFIPFDFYLSDTVYANDLWPDRKPVNYSWTYGFKPLEDAITYIVPLVMDCIVGLPEGKKRFVQIAEVGYRPYTTFKRVDYYDCTYNIINIKLAGREWVKTPAGSFYCNKFCMEFTTDGSDIREEVWLYLNSVVGLVKFDQFRNCVELTSIRK